MIASISIHALLAESDIRDSLIERSAVVFLSTLSLRRATAAEHLSHGVKIISIHALLAESDQQGAETGSRKHHFYPRSPCGERPPSLYIFSKHPGISIHALLAESDAANLIVLSKLPTFLSTLSLRRATSLPIYLLQTPRHFYPRSPCGERPYSANKKARCTAYFYPRSPCGERLEHVS